MENVNLEYRRYAALEITSKAVKLVYGFVQKELVYVLYAGEASVDALVGGQLVNSDVLTAAIRNVIDDCSIKMNIRLKEVILVLPPMGLAFGKQPRTTNTISPDNKIVQIDIENAISLLRKASFGPQLQIIDVIPYRYVLDNQEIYTEPPIGKISSSLSVQATLYALEPKTINSYVDAVEKASLKVRRCVIAPFASSLYFKNIDYIPSRYLLLNIGAKITTLSLIDNDTMIVQNACYSKGGDLITQALADKFNIPFKDAKMLKEKYGIQNPPSFRCLIYNDLTLKDISDTIYEAIVPLIASLRKTITSWFNQQDLKIPLVLTGGGTKLYGLSTILEQELSLDCMDVTPYSFGARDKSYQNLLGAIKYADIYVPKRDEDSLIKVNLNRVGQQEKQKNKQTISYRIQDEL